METVDAGDDTATVKNGIDLGQLLAHGTTFEIEGSRVDFSSDLFEVNDDDAFDDLKIEANENPYKAQSFSDLSKEMVKVSNFISKKILVEGTTEIPKFAEVKVHYNAFFEGQTRSFDSTYMQGEPLKFVVGNGPGFEGFHLAILTMKKGEESQFIISYTLLYGELGSPPRIPAKADALFVIKVIDVKEPRVKASDPQSEVYDKYNQATAFNVQAKQEFKQKKYDSAISHYKRAVSEISDAEVNNQDERDTKNGFLCRTYLNLGVCYNKVNKPERACAAMERMNAIQSIQDNSKALYTLGCAQLALNRYKEAEQSLQRAAQLNPDNEDISRVRQRLSVAAREYFERERNMCINAIGAMQITKENTSEMAENSELTIVRGILREFKESTAKSVVLPMMLTATEMKFIRKLGPELGIKIEEVPTEQCIQYKLVKTQDLICNT